MTDGVPGPGTKPQQAQPEAGKKVRWPLGFSLRPPKEQQGQQSLQAYGVQSKQPAKKRWWSHTLYRGPKDEPVEILYSRTIEDSEKIARQFLGEDVVGFDMEWPWNDWKRSDLQNKIGLIQVATETRIALFHIGLHVGKTTDDIIAPSLRKLIENPKIGKLGVGVLSADFARLRRFFYLNPKGAMELSHLYRLVKFGGRKPELVSTKLVSLARLVEDQLGYPLYKGDVRTSNWSKPLSKDQINYAAGDAYAGIMLYHCMNYKRLQMKPAPPLPIHAEKYLAYKLSGVIPLRLDAQAEDGSIMTSEAFFGVQMEDSATTSKTKTDAEVKKTKVSKPEAPKIPKELVDALSQSLYQELSICRARLAKEAEVAVYRITTNAVLIELALHRPTNDVELGAIKGVGPKQQKTYGDEWLRVISQHNVRLAATDSAKKALEPIKQDTTEVTQRDVAEPPSTPRRDYKRGRRKSQSSDFSAAFGTPPPRAPQLHTGLSFTLADTRLSSEPEEGSTAGDSDDWLPELNFGGETASVLKRKRAESPTKREASNTTINEPQTRVIEASHTDAPISGADTKTSLTSPIPRRGEFLDPNLRIARNKLQAFSRLVTRKMKDRPLDAPPIISDRTLSLIVVRAPQTQDELDRIPGIDRFVLACQQTDTDLLKNVIKFVPPR